MKRVFCPKKECYDPKLNANGQYGKPLPSFSWLLEQGVVYSLDQINQAAKDSEKGSTIKPIIRLSPV